MTHSSIGSVSDKSAECLRKKSEIRLLNASSYMYPLELQ